MASEMRLDMRLTGLSSLTSSLNLVHDTLGEINERMSRLATSFESVALRIERAANMFRTVGGAFNVSGGGAGGGTSTTKKYKTLEDVFNPESEQPSNGGGSPGGARTHNSLLYALLSGQFRSLFARSMVQNKALVELVGRFTKILGVLGFLYTAAKMTFSLLADVARMNRQAGTIAGLTGDRSMSNQAMVRGLANKLGLDPGAVAGKISSLPATTEQFKYFLDTIRSFKSDKEALYFARSPGVDMTDYLAVRQLTEQQYRDALSGKGIMPLEGTQGSQEQASFERLWDSTKVILGSLKYANPFYWMAKGAAWSNDMALGQGKAPDKLEKAADKLYDAADKFGMNVGLHGGGPRTKRAFPESWAWYGNKAMILTDARQLGAFEL